MAAAGRPVKTVRRDVGFSVNLDHEAREIRRDGRSGWNFPMEPADAVDIPRGKPSVRTRTGVRTALSANYAGRDRIQLVASPGVMHDRTIVIGAESQFASTRLLESSSEGASDK